MVLHSNKLEPPSPKVAMCQIWLKLARGRSGEFVNVFSLCLNYLPLGKRVGPFNKLESPSNKDALL